MDEQTMERIFEPFFTTKEVGKGTGLGLASVYGIVKQHNGYITVSSDLCKGTTFDIYLPLVDGRTTQEAPPSGEIKGGTETILIVEDDRDVRNMLTKILESQGYTTMEAMDGDDAITGLSVSTRRAIDLVILDVVMPGKNGKEVLDEIVAHRPRGQGDLRERLHGRRRHRQGHSERERRLSPEAPVFGEAAGQSPRSPRPVNRQ